MASTSSTGAGEQTALLGEGELSGRRNAGVAKQLYRHDEDVGSGSPKELSGGRLALVLGVVWFGSFLAAFGNKRAGKTNLEETRLTFQMQQWSLPSQHLSRLLLTRRRCSRG